MLCEGTLPICFNKNACKYDSVESLISRASAAIIYVLIGKKCLPHCCVGHLNVTQMFDNGGVHYVPLLLAFLAQAKVIM